MIITLSLGARWNSFIVDSVVEHHCCSQKTATVKQDDTYYGEKQTILPKTHTGDYILTVKRRMSP